MNLMIRFTLHLILLSLLPLVSAGQCTGSFGTPVLNTTFGAGTGTGTQLAAGTTNLIYNNNGCPGDGLYSIVNQSLGCWNGDWDVVSGHTGDVNGYFMLINSDYQPSEFYVQTINNLCDGTTYNFSAWIININNRSGYIKPNVTMSIETPAGVVLQTYNTGDIPHTSPAVWQRFGMTFTTPSGIMSIKLKMKNNAAGGNGNDLGLDDITLRAVGPGIALAANGDEADSVTICSEASLTLSAVVGACYGTTAYQWQISRDLGVTWANIANATSSSYASMQTDTGIVKYRLIVAHAGNIGNTNCQVISSVKTILPRLPAPIIQVNGRVLTTANAYVNYQWYHNGTLIPGATSRNYTATTGGSYSVKVTNQAGCIANSPSVIMSDVGISNAGLKNVEFTIFPNPAHHDLNINAGSLNPNETVTIELMDVVGKKIAVLYYGKAAGLKNNIALPQQASGLYFIKLGTDGNYGVRPLQVF